MTMSVNPDVLAATVESLAGAEEHLDQVNTFLDVINLRRWRGEDDTRARIQQLRHDAHVLAADLMLLRLDLEDES